MFSCIFYIPGWYKTQEKCDRITYNLFPIKYIPGQYKTQQINVSVVYNWEYLDILKY